MPNKKDDKVRVRCTGCGKRIKFPANVPGATFRCPICKTTIVAPLDGKDVEEQQPIGPNVQAPAAAAPAPTQRSAQPPVQATAPAPTQAPAPQSPAIERLNTFILREQQRTGILCNQIIRNKRLSTEQKTSELIALRHQKAVSIRSFTDAMLRDFKRSIEELRNCPSADTETGKKRVQEEETELAGIQLYLKVMYQMRTVEQDNNQNGATRSTPETAKQPPSKASSPDTQTSQN